MAEALAAMRAAAVPGASTATSTTSPAGCSPPRRDLELPGLPRYPATICASVNDRVVHGIPSAGEVLADGDLVSIDFGAVVEGWHGDSAVTVAVGTPPAEHTALSETTRRAMWDGIAAIREGGHVTDVSHAVETSVRSAPGGDRLGIVENYGGHGIGTAMHMDPPVLNYGRPGGGVAAPRDGPGHRADGDPGGPATRLLDDGWTVITADGARRALEHTVALPPDGLWVLTAAGRRSRGAAGPGRPRCPPGRCPTAV